MRIFSLLSLFATCFLFPPMLRGTEGTEQCVGTPSAPDAKRSEITVKGCDDPPLLDGKLQPKFVNRLVNVADPSYIFKPHCTTKDGIQLYKIKRRSFNADLGIVDAQLRPLLTPMFGYTTRGVVPTFPGKTIVVDSHVPIKVYWKNNLITKRDKLPIPLPPYVPVDQTIHLARPMHPPYPQSGLPTIVHLHGGLTEQFSDGYPEAWSTPHFAQNGPFFKKKIFHYDNDQESTLLWYHDHTLGYTRLNNYVGLVGAYVIRDCQEKKLIRENEIPSGAYELPLVITDKMFTADGQLFFPACDPLNPQAPVPTVLPEFFGDFMLVNGKAWPLAEVEPRPYRIRVLNGCDSRFLDLSFSPQHKNGPEFSFYQIGTDQGLLDSPVLISHLLIAPGQRADLVVDFSASWNQTLVLTNSANTPYPMGPAPDPLSTALVMAFQVSQPLNPNVPIPHLPEHLRCQPIQRLVPTAPNRQVLLFEGRDEYNRILPLLGTPAKGSLPWHAPITETPLLGTTEIWEIYNTTMDAHPIHLHAGAFQIIDRQHFGGNFDPQSGVLTSIEMLGNPTPPLPAESGWFDTTIAPPMDMDAHPQGAIGQRTRIIMKFLIPGLYVWHCHILSHEDHDMMRPMFIRKTADEPIPSVMPMMPMAAPFN